jgi:NAD(P)-dependent dehydrogenase (short-subunit alcohol dehydrogenase family)
MAASARPRVFGNTVRASNMTPYASNAKTRITRQGSIDDVAYDIVCNAVAPKKSQPDKSATCSATKLYWNRARGARHGPAAAVLMMSRNSTFLASAEISFITDAKLMVDGGRITA